MRGSRSGRGRIAAGLLAGVLTLAVACSGGSSTESPMPSETPDAITASPTLAPTAEPTRAPTPEPSQTPIEWSEENITAQIDSAVSLVHTLSEFNPGVEFFDTILAQTQTAK